MDRLANKLANAEKMMDIMLADVARLTAERDALKAEVEAMRAVVEAARTLRDADYDDVYVAIDTALRALDALRTRKVGGQ